jgi:GTP:adenosylcobinamide-phosphate guanylyltransferase
MSEQPQQLPVAVLAGGSGDKVTAASGAPSKALVEIAGRPMIAWVLAPLCEAERVSEVVVVEGPAGGLKESIGEQARVARARGPAFLDTVHAAVEALPESERIVLVPGDLPMLTPQAIDGFVASCLQTPAELSYAIVAADEFERAFPGRGKTVVRLRDGRVTAGNVACVSRRFVLEHGRTIARVFAARKNPVAMLRMFGWSFVLRLMRGRLSVADLEARASEMLGGTLRAVRCEHPELGFDVDDLHDLKLAEECLVRRLDVGQSAEQ